MASIFPTTAADDVAERFAKVGSGPSNVVRCVRTSGHVAGSSPFGVGRGDGSPGPAVCSGFGVTAPTSVGPALDGAKSTAVKTPAVRTVITVAASAHGFLMGTPHTPQRSRTDRSAAPTNR